MSDILNDVLARLAAEIGDLRVRLAVAEAERDRLRADQLEAEQPPTLPS